MRDCFISRRSPIAVGIASLFVLGLPAAAQTISARGPAHRFVHTPVDIAERDRLMAMRSTIFLRTSPAARAEVLANRKARALCSRYWNVQVPVTYTPGVLELVEFSASLGKNEPSCSSRSLFIGSHDERDQKDVAPDLHATLRCATMESLIDGVWTSNVEGYSMLAILYGEGAGVPQSWSVAAHYACLAIPWTYGPARTLEPGDAFRTDASPAGNLSLIFAIDEAMTAGEAPESFDGCDDPLAGDSNAVEKCTAFRQDRMETAVALKYFDHAHSTVDYVPNPHAFLFNQSIDQDTLALAAMTVDLKSALADAAVKRGDYDALLSAIANKSLPDLTASDLATSDAALNHLYNEMKCWLGCRLDPAIATSFQDAERSWLQYRDEMASEAGSSVPEAQAQVAKTAVLALLTEQRVAAFKRWIDALQPDHQIW